MAEHCTPGNIDGESITAQDKDWTMDRRSLLQMGGVTAAGWLAASPAAWAQARDFSAVDRLQLEDLIGRLTWALDTGDGPALVAAMTADGAVQDRTGKRWTAAGFAENFAGANPRRGRQHEMQINAVRGTARGEAVVESYWATVVWTAGEPTARVDALGTYVDTCVRRSGEWLVRDRVIRTWDSSTAPVMKLKGADQ
jgi:hypothetical protein